MKTRVIAVERGFVVTIIFTLGLLLLAASEARAADYSYWYGPQDLKIMRETRPPAGAPRASLPTTPPTLHVSAAQAEYEGRQIAIRPSGALQDVVIEASDLTKTIEGTEPAATVRAGNISVLWVKYVLLRYRSYGQYARVPGYYPDALPPTKLLDGTVVARDLPSGITQPFYVLFYVPEGTPKGTYTGTLTIRSADASVSAVSIPVSFRVYGFSIAKRNLKTSFGFSIRHAKYFASDDHYWPSPWESPEAETTSFGGDSLTRWIRFLSEHRVAPQTMMPGFSTPGSDGSLLVRQEYIDDFTGTGAATTYEGQRLNFNTLPLPDKMFMASYVTNPFSSWSARVKAITYYRSMTGAYGPGNVSKTLVYAIDEPYANKRAFVESYGAFVHKYLPGSKFIVTIDPARFGFRRFYNIDIYVHKLHYWYRDYRRWIAPILRSRRQVWIYSHLSPMVKYAPLYLIDKPVTDSRIQGWFAFTTNAPGMMYYSINRWQSPYRGSTAWRDPYRNPLSLVIRASGYVEYANGDGTLVYPGYYPSLGLTIPGAGPVSSLRMEALRDGLEDYEYLRLLQAKKGRAYALAYAAKCINTRRLAGGFPVYTKSPYTVRSAREQIARILEQ